MENWAEIRRLHFAEKLGIKSISKRLSISRNTVRAAVRAATPPAYRRKRRPSAVDPYEPQIRELLRDCNTMPATVIERPIYLEPDPFQRTDYQPGELAQWDIWLPDVDVPVGYGHSARLPVVVEVSGYSRVIVGRMIPSREAPDLLLGHLACLFDLGAVPRKGVYDNESAIGRKRRDGTMLVNAGTGEALGVVEHRSAKALRCFLCEQGHRWLKGVEVVVTEGSEPYRTAIATYLSHATHVVDRFPLRAVVRFGAYRGP